MTSAAIFSVERFYGWCIHLLRGCTVEGINDWSKISCILMGFAMIMLLLHCTVNADYALKSIMRMQSEIDYNRLCVIASECC